MYAGAFLVAVAQPVGVLRLLDNDGLLDTFTTDQRHAYVLLESRSTTTSGMRVCSSMATLLSDGSIPEISPGTIVGELLPALWLLIWGRRARVDQPSGSVTSGSWGTAAALAHTPSTTSR